MCGPVALVRERLPTDHGPWVDRLLGRIAAREVTPRQASREVFEFLWPGRWAFARRVAKVLESYRRKWEDLTHFYDHRRSRGRRTPRRAVLPHEPGGVKRRFRTAAGSVRT